MVGLVALQLEEPLVYDSNVLIILRERSLDDVKEVLNVKREVERELKEGVTISPLITTSEDKELIEKFLVQAKLGIKRKF